MDMPNQRDVALRALRAAGHTQAVGDGTEYMNRQIREKFGSVAPMPSAAARQALEADLEQLGHDPTTVNTARRAWQVGLDAAETASLIADVDPAAGRVAADALGASWADDAPTLSADATAIVDAIQQDPPGEQAKRDFETDLRAAAGIRS